MIIQPKQSLKGIRKTYCNQPKNETDNNQNDLVSEQKAQCTKPLETLRPQFTPIKRWKND